jgi:N-acetylmuramoyl-L-alanine amidase CwlD
VQGKNNNTEKNIPLSHKNRIKLRHSILLMMIASICIILVSSIGVTPKTEAALVSDPPAQPAFAPQPVNAAEPSVSVAQVIPGASDKCIVLDPGHGGVDPGGFIGDAYEDEINLSITLLVKASLEEYGFRVVMTREDDETVSIKDRLATAIASDADILVSIHQNALEDDTVTNGIETWYYKKASDSSKYLAECIQGEIIAESGAKDRGLRPDRSLIITKKAEMPSCLVETGFLTGANERKRLKSEAYREKLAQGIVSGIVKYFETQLPE